MASSKLSFAAPSHLEILESSDDDDDNESDIDSVGSNSSVYTNDHDDASKGSGEVQHLAQRESRIVYTWRWVVVLLLVAAGVVVSTGTYIFLTRTEQATYENSYVLFVNTMKDFSANHVRNLQQAFRGMAETYRVTASRSNMTWPYVTLPVMEVHGSHLREASGVELVTFAPVVTQEQRPAWRNWTWENQGWLNESYEIAEQQAASSGSSSNYESTSYQKGSISDDLFRRDGISPDFPIHFPIWQCSPPPFSSKFINYNIMGTSWMNDMLPALAIAKEGLFTNVYNLSILTGIATSPADHLDFHRSFADTVTEVEAYDRPHSVLVQPIFAATSPDADLVAMLAAVVPWDLYLTNLLPQGVDGITVVLANDCNQSFTYSLNGNRPSYVGLGDLHDPAFDSTKTIIPMFDYLHPNVTALAAGHCQYSFVVYASRTFLDNNTSKTPLIFTIVVAATFVLVIVTFVIYDRFVQRRNTKVIDAAAKSNAILSSLFPSNVRARLFAEGGQDKRPDDGDMAAAATAGTKTKLRNFLDDGAVGTEELGYGSAPIADFFPETTVMFADISGFTAWSSVREPAQVFTLLETLYRAFDSIAKRRRIFKVETIGDCYVAVSGLPEPRKDHAVAMARFARECVLRMRALTKKLEISLGPDTGDLDMRVGLHSGPVTAGVLRGERSRFQLFGDTMNTASRMESTGLRGRIQISQETADLLIAGGKTEWIILRKDTVVAKGKGEMQTYWLDLGITRSAANSSSVASSENGERKTEERELDAAVVSEVSKREADKTSRLVEWNVDVLIRLLKQIILRRQFLLEREPGRKEDADESVIQADGRRPIEEVREIITIPPEHFQEIVKNADKVQLPSDVVEQLYDYVSNIAALYHNNPFHNFEHASHVTMSVTKLLSRIVAPSETELGENATLHDHTYGITSDPLTQFACVVAALIHDVDHPGVPNMQLVKEKTVLAQHYQDKSVAEQNSLDLAWNLLMDDCYTDLRRSIYTTAQGLQRFRQLLVNAVMATDIVDKELKMLRNARWSRAFSEGSCDTSRDAVNRKATIVIEHLIQASDVAHTMQHWHIYRKWNERFFMECYGAYKMGRAEKNPAEGWYEGEIGFFDFYIIPLARKLKDCGVFGVSSDEYLNYATRNRKEWEERGREVVDEMVEKVNQLSWAVPQPAEESAPKFM